jgi:hypothetical protein
MFPESSINPLAGRLVVLYSGEDPSPINRAISPLDRANRLWIELDLLWIERERWPEADPPGWGLAVLARLIARLHELELGLRLGLQLGLELCLEVGLEQGLMS